VVAVSSFKSVFSQTNVCLRWTIVVRRNCSLIYNEFDQTHFRHWALLFLSTVTLLSSLVVAVCDSLVLLCPSMVCLILGMHATVAYFNSVAVDLSEYVVNFPNMLRLSMCL
jgi:hypothetical protein